MSQRLSRTHRRLVKVALAMLVATSSLTGVVYALSAYSGHAKAHRASSSRLLELTPQPALRRIAAGASARYRIHVRRGDTLVRASRDGQARLAAKVSLSVARPLPAGVTAVFERRSTRTTLALLTLTAAPGTRPGTYHLRLRGRGRLYPHPPYVRRYARATVTLVVVAPQHGAVHSFAIHGTVPVLLAPGTASPVDLSITNPRDSSLSVRWLAVSIASVQAPQADANHPCTLADFTVVQFSGTYGFGLARASTRSLSAMAIPAPEWPWIVMRNRPVNQDGCKGASLTLRLTGLGIGSGE